jgi:hypothetical protein
VDVNRAYNDHWMDSRRLKITSDKRTSLIVDPPDGRMPPRVPLPPEREKIRAARAAANDRFNAGLPLNYTDFSLPVQCIIRTDSPPYLPTIYNNDFHIFQSPGFVVINPEMIHSARIIPLDGSPHLGKDLHQWLGDSRGHWEGNTLVIETTNFTDKTSIGSNGVGYNGEGGRHSEALKVIERLTRVDDNTLNYQATIDDPKTWTRPWTMLIELKRDNNYQFLEYACHEGNYAMKDILAGARADEAAKAK